MGPEIKNLGITDLPIYDVLEQHFPITSKHFGALLVRLTIKNLFTNNLVSHTRHPSSLTKTPNHEPFSPVTFKTFRGEREAAKRNLH